MDEANPVTRADLVRMGAHQFREPGPRALRYSRSTQLCPAPERFIKANQVELEEHGYHVVEGAKNVKALVEDMGMDAHIFKQTVRLGLFTIDAALSFAMVLTESEPAKTSQFTVLPRKAVRDYVCPGHPGNELFASRMG